MDEDGSTNTSRKKRKGATAPTIDLTATELPRDEPVAPEEKAVAEEAVTARPMEPEALDETAETVAAAATDAPGAAPQAAPEEIPIREQPRVEPEPGLFVEPPPQRQSLLPLAVASVIGGLVGAGIVFAALLSGILPGLQWERRIARLGALEQDVASNRDITERVTSRLTALEQGVKTATGQATAAMNLVEEARTAGAAGAQGTADLGPLDQRLSRLEAAGEQLKTSLSDSLGQTNDRATAAATTATEVQAQLGEVLRRIASLQTDVDRATPEKAAAYTVALGQLSEAVRDGRPFEAELETAAALGGEASRLSSLQPLAASGAPSIAGLAMAFEAIAPAVTEALVPAESGSAPQGGIADRLWFGLGRVVSVTRDGEAGPGDPKQPVAVIREALRRGDLAGAVAAFEALPEPARAAGAAWLTQAKATLDALVLLRAETGAALQKLASE